MKKLIFIYLFLLFQAHSSLACTCFNPPISRVLNETDAIFFGKVVGFEQVYRFPDGEIVYFTEFEVIRYWYKEGMIFKDTPQYVSVAQTYMGGGCGIQNFDMEKKYLIYAPYQNGFLQTRACGKRVLEETYRDFKTDLDSLKILGFQEKNVTLNQDTVNITKYKLRYFQKQLEVRKDSLKQSYENKLFSNLNQRFYYEIFALILLLAIILLILLSKKRKR